MAEIPTTQRAYTLRLHGADKHNQAWRQALWDTHEAVNSGAKVFGDWLLTLRGGLDHALADQLPLDPKSGEGKKLIASTLKELNDEKKTDEPAPAEHDVIAEIERRRIGRIRDRRILLALSWLSVESSPKPNDPQKKFEVASGRHDSQSARDEKVGAKLREILVQRGITGADLENWIADCEPSLSAAIRADAVWVNRSGMFGAAQEQVGPSLTRQEVWDLLKPFFGDPESYLAPINKPGDDDDDASAEEDKPKDLGEKAGQWLSSRFGTGKGADFPEMRRVYIALRRWSGRRTGFESGALAIQDACAKIGDLLGYCPVHRDANSLLKLMSGPGYKSATRNIIKHIAGATNAVPTSDLGELREATAKDAKSCREKAGGKGRRPWSDKILEKVESACGFTYLQKDGPARHTEFSVMLDHAARRVSSAHTWIKRAESRRQKFKIDAAKIDNVPADAKSWLDRFCEARSKSSGAIDAYRIRRRAAGGWKEVVARWARVDGMTGKDLHELGSSVSIESSDGSERSLAERARVAAAREAQADPNIEKFGDIQLFEALAAEDANVVWRVNDEATAQPLMDYVAAADALAKQKRFKVPAYRHPDPLSHPVFCDFGNSRWEIRFAVHDAASKLTDAKAAVVRREKELEKAKERLAKSRTPEKQADAQSKLRDVEDDLRKKCKRVAWLESRHALSMKLWDGGKLDNGIPLRWACKRLTKDLGLRDQSTGAATATINVTRADRLGRAGVGADEKSPVHILGVFDQADWNGRLQAPRSQLDEIARHVKNDVWSAKAKKLRDHIRWLVSFSAKLQPAGPWMDYVARFPEDAPAKPFVSRNGDYAVKHLTNDGRSGHAKLILSRLPRLRILSVDLGHRFAAACAVWETVRPNDFLTEISGKSVIAGGTGPENLYLHARHTDQNGKVRATIYRRIGADTLPDGKPHPAPWARLDRQFLIKLPGEHKPARAASNKQEHGANEMALVAKLAEGLGFLRDENEKATKRDVDELMRAAMRTAALGLKRHGRRAKIAYALNPNCPGIPTIGGGLKLITRGDKEHVRFLTDAMFDWHSLATDDQWDGTDARKLWNNHVSSLPVGFSLAEPARRDNRMEGATRQKRRKENEAFRDGIIQPIARYLAKVDLSVTLSMHGAWKERWTDADGQCAVVPKVPEGQKGPARTEITRAASGWHAHLRLLTDWIMGWHLPGAESRLWSRNVGGLSLTRIATMRSLYQLHKAFDMRPRPERVLGAPKLGETNKGTAQSILDAMERMREQRVKQLASRIAGSALGLGGHWEQVDTRRKSPNGRAPMNRVWVEEPTAKYAPCHAVVIENLTNYRPEETQTRRENKQLMAWSSSKVKKYLSEACQLHGLHLRQVQAGYTSRQDSRTGAPGYRCVDARVDMETGTVHSYWWPKALSAAEKKVADGSKDAESLFLVNVAKHLHELQAAGKPLPPAVRVPRKGGDLFVGAPSWAHLKNGDKPDLKKLAKRATQADLNAAANIGLKALLDPDFTGKWWFIPCQSATHEPLAEKTKGSLVIAPDISLLPVNAADPETSGPQKGKKRGRAKAGKREREIVNLWRDISVSPIDANSPWRGTTEYWNDVRCRVIALLAQIFHDEKPIEVLETPW